MASRRSPIAGIAWRTIMSGYRSAAREQSIPISPTTGLGIPAYQDKVPYNVSLVDLDEGGRLVTNVVDCPPEEVKIGMAVEVVFEDLPDYTLPKFQPVK